MHPPVEPAVPTGFIKMGPENVGAPRSFSPEQIELFQRVFKGRGDAYIAQQPDGKYIRKAGPVDGELIRKHLSHEVTIALYSFEPGNSTCTLCVFDVDFHEPADLKKSKEVHLKVINQILDAIESLGIKRSQIHLEWTGRGYHIWLFFDEPIEARQVRQFGQLALSKAGQPHHEFFPKQSRVGEGGFGSGVKPPLGINRHNDQLCVFTNDQLGAIADQWAYLDAADKNRVASDIIKKAVHAKQPARKESAVTSAPLVGSSASCEQAIEPFPCFKTLIQSGARHTERDKASFVLSQHLSSRGCPKEDALAFMLDWHKKMEQIPGEIFTERDIHSKVDAAYTKTYAYGCSDEVLAKRCEFSRCVGVWDWVAKEMKKHPATKGSGGSMSHADRLIWLAMQEGLILFHDETKTPFARIKQSSHLEIWPIDSTIFGLWLGRLFYRDQGRAIYAEAVKTAKEALSAMAIFDGPTHGLHTRVAWHEGAIMVDLSDPEWRAIRISPGQWEIISEPPVLFRRYLQQTPQVEPQRNGDLKRILDFVNISKSGDQLLFMVSLVSSLVPGIPHPVDVPYGGHGGAKTTLLDIKKSLIDPSEFMHLGFPKTPADMAQLLQHNWVVCFDNVGELSDEWSDALCRAVTGDAFYKRKLYTDDDEVVFKYKRLIGLNSINLAIRQPDLLDRCILYRVAKVPKEKCLDEKRFWGNFEREKPHILGGILDALAKAMSILPSITDVSLFRMADFTRWGCAIAEAIGYRREDFIDAYGSNIQIRNDEAIQANPVAVALREFMKQRSLWEGSPSALLTELDSVAPALKIDTKQKFWPKNPVWMTRRLNVVKSNLEEVGIIILQDEDQWHFFHITNTALQVPKNAAPPAETTGWGHEDECIPE